MNIIFEAGTGRHFPGGVNYLLSIDGKLYAECPVPDGASDDYGYLTMKNALLSAYKGDPDILVWWYDGQENLLAPDASADCEVYVEVEDD